MGDVLERLIHLHIINYINDIRNKYDISIEYMLDLLDIRANDILYINDKKQSISTKQYILKYKLSQDTPIFTIPPLFNIINIYKDELSHNIMLILTSILSNMNYIPHSIVFNITTFYIELYVSLIIL